MKTVQIPSGYEDSANAFIYAYAGVYGRVPPKGFLPYTSDGETDVFEGIEKDIHLQNEWIKALNSIPNIQILSTCEGHENIILTHIIFTVINNDLNLDNIYDRLQKIPETLRGTKAVALETSIGICFCISIYNWYRSTGQNIKWTNWWTNIIPYIYIAVNHPGE